MCCNSLMPATPLMSVITGPIAGAGPVSAEEAIVIGGMLTPARSPVNTTVQAPPVEPATSTLFEPPTEPRFSNAACTSCTVASNGIGPVSRATAPLSTVSLNVPPEVPVGAGINWTSCTAV